MRKLLLLCGLLGLLADPCRAEPQRPVGRFLLDSVKIGDSVQFALTCRHSSRLEVLFPDSAISFSPFELISKRYYPTRTLGLESTDSVVYTLRTFELQPWLRLSLPVYELSGPDSLPVYSTPDSIRLIELIGADPGASELAEQTAIVPLEVQFNYLYLLAVLSMAGLLLGALLLVFGKAIRRRYRLYVLQNRFRAFQDRFDLLLKRFTEAESIQTLEQAIVLWKNYLTELEDRPIISFTTKEVAEFYDEEILSIALGVCDRAIYGNIMTNQQHEASSALQALKYFAVSRYTAIKDLMSNAVPVGS